MYKSAIMESLVWSQITGTFWMAVDSLGVNLYSLSITSLDASESARRLFCGTVSSVLNTLILHGIRCKSKLT